MVSIKKGKHIKLDKYNLFDYFNIVFFIVLCFIMLYPFWNVLMTSLVSQGEYLKRTFILWPQNMQFDSYRYIFASDRLPRSFVVTIFVTVAGTLYSTLMTLAVSYALTKKPLPGYKLFIALIMIPMFFGGGLIPYYLLIQNLGLMNSIWVTIIPGGIGVWNFLVFKSFIGQIPDGLEEAAVIDGANEIYIFFRIIIPLSLPSIAAICLFTAVGRWNDYMTSMLYLARRPDLHTLQLILRKLIVENQRMGDMETEYRKMFGDVVVFEDGIKMAAVVVVTAPILFVYPFLQKYFVKGVYLGSVKG